MNFDSYIQFLVFAGFIDRFPLTTYDDRIDYYTASMTTGLITVRLLGEELLGPDESNTLITYNAVIFGCEILISSRRLYSYSI